MPQQTRNSMETSTSDHIASTSSARLLSSTSSPVTSLHVSAMQMGNVGSLPVANIVNNVVQALQGSLEGLVQPTIDACLFVTSTAAVTNNAGSPCLIQQITSLRMLPLTIWNRRPQITKQFIQLMVWLVVLMIIYLTPEFQFSLPCASHRLCPNTWQKLLVLLLLTSARKNKASATAHPKIVDTYLQNEVALGRVAGPFLSSQLPNLHVTSFGVIPKAGQPGKWRLILDLSSPHGRSVNDGIDPEQFSLQYIKFDEVVAMVTKLGWGALMAKFDVQSAYRNVAVLPSQHHLLGMKWRGKLYVDLALPFGLCSAPFIFNSIADVIEWIMHNNYASPTLCTTSTTTLQPVHLISLNVRIIWRWPPPLVAVWAFLYIPIKWTVPLLV
ncbi:Hypothetical predicted protein [Paramuricea clavata]|uniref:Uncharacterized protein n=1 Tax=Paramuricea clavata TaxID=317549 RepID=A0A7D9EUV2_PARCT|nr:Hypothetical predicted protein [Paramuricea clavata]